MILFKIYRKFGDLLYYTLLSIFFCRDTQYGVRLSKTCHKQLESFLSKNPNIQEIVRDHIQIDIIDTPNRTVPYLDVFTGGLLGQQVDGKFCFLEV